MSIIVSRFFLHKDVKKIKQNKTKQKNERTNERNNVPTPRQYQAGNHYQGMDSSRAKVFV